MRIFAAFCMVLVGYAAHAKETNYMDALYKCTQLASAQKTACLNRLANQASEEYLQKHPGEEAKKPPEKSKFVNGFRKSGNWVLEERTSKLTDSRDIYASLNSDNAVTCRSGTQTGKITLMLRCKENTTSMFFSTDCFMASSKYDDSGHINYRLDKLTPGKIRAIESTDHGALGLWTGGRSIPFIKKMKDRKSLIARMRPYSGTAFEANFNITGINEVITEVREACHW